MTDPIQLKAVIVAAFAGVCAPAPDRLLIGNGWEHAAIIRDFKPFLGCDGGVPNEVLERYKDALANFSVDGLHWVLPQYMLLALERPRSEIGDFVIYHLAGVDSSDSSYWQPRLRIFTAQQREAICEFVRNSRARGDVATDEFLAGAERVWCESAEKLR